LPQESRQQAADPWDPDRYEIFERERARPFRDLVTYLAACPGGRVVDLGCGTGALTAELAGALQAAEVVGLDQSAAMLKRAQAHAGEGVRFAQADVSTFADEEAWDVVLSNATLHWIPDHDRLFGRLARALRPGGQLAVGMPMNFDHPAWRAAAELAAEPPWAEALAGRTIGSHVDPPERYAERLHAHGLEAIAVDVRVYLHELPDAGAVHRWTRGALLTWYESRIGAERFAAFDAEYRRRVLDRLGDARPYPFTFKRLFVYGRRRSSSNSASR
jgi:trans-aconitate 2-methyltransferase